MRRPLRRAMAPIIFACLIGTLLLTVLWDRIVITIPVGQGGVLWHMFGGGTRLDAGTLGEGMHVIFPWNKIFLYDMRLRTHTETYEIVSNDGLQIRVRMHFRWRVVSENLPTLAKTIGPEYLPKLLVPAVGSVLADIVSQYEAEAIYSEHRATIQSRILEEATSDRIRNGIGLYGDSDLGDDVIALVDVLIREVILPTTVQEAIQRKLSESEYVQEYVYRLKRERLEAERKAIEASGIKRFQETVTPGMSDNYLKWRGIEATQRLAASPNSKIIIMGNGDKGLPVILNAGTDAAGQRSDGPDRATAAEPENGAEAAQRAKADAEARTRGLVEMERDPEMTYDDFVPFPTELLFTPETQRAE